MFKNLKNKLKQTKLCTHTIAEMDVVILFHSLRVQLYDKFRAPRDYFLLYNSWFYLHCLILAKM